MFKQLLKTGTHQFTKSAIKSENAAIEMLLGMKVQFGLRDEQLTTIQFRKTVQTNVVAKQYSNIYLLANN